MNINFEQVISKLDTILARGLSAGIGNRDGMMCIEAALCCALDLPHGDDPGCVAASVRAFKIQLNDCAWSSPIARAKGLRNLGIAQLGSRGVVNDDAFRDRLTFLTITVLIPRLFMRYPWGQTVAQMCAEAKTLAQARAWVAGAAGVAGAVGTVEAAWVAWAAGRAEVAGAAGAVGIAWAAGTASAQNKNNPVASHPDEFLLLSADLALQVLKELRSPGAAYV